MGNSPPILNVLWGFANLAIGLLIATRHARMPGIGLDALAGLAGGLAMGIYLLLHFGKVQRDKQLN